MIATYLRDVKGYEVKGREFGTRSAIGVTNGEDVAVENGREYLSVVCNFNYGFSETGPFDRSIIFDLTLSNIIGLESKSTILKFDTTEFPAKGFYFYFMNYFYKKTLSKH